MFSVFATLMAQLRNIVSDRRDLVLENAALGHQLAIYQRKDHRPHLTSAVTIDDFDDDPDEQEEQS